MAINPNHVPWLSLVGLVGLGVGHGVGRLIGFSGEPMLPALYGLCAGTLVGLVVRVIVRQRTLRRVRQADPGPPGEG